MVVIDGHPTQAKLVGYQALVYSYGESSRYNKFCGGVLVGAYWALTTVTCLGIMLPELSSVLAGVDKKGEGVDGNGNGQNRNVYKFIKHPQYKGFHWTHVDVYQHDVALVKVFEQFYPSATVWFAKIPTRFMSPPNPDDLGLVCGWGANNRYTLDDWLRCTRTRLMTNEECAKYYSFDQQHPLFKSVFCTSPGVCEYDAGGAWIFNETVWGIVQSGGWKGGSEWTECYYYDPPIPVFHSKIVDSLNFINGYLNKIWPS